MSDSFSRLPSAEENSYEEEPPEGKLTEPQFGVVDMVEAFTAMRHEWRGQTKENRQLAEQMQTALAVIQDLEAKLLARTADPNPPSTTSAKEFAERIVETDHQLTRAAQAIEQMEHHRKLREESESAEINQCVANLSGLARWFARPLLRLLTQQRKDWEQTLDNTGIDGLNLVISRLRRSMKDLDIERIETLGKAFDPNLMNAIGSMETTEQPTGHVAEELSPCYQWQGKVLRFADVRVAQ